MGRARRLQILFSIVIGIVGVDYLSKRVVMQTGIERPLGVFFGVVRLGYAENHGGSLGLGSQLTADTQFWIFTVGGGSLLFGTALWATVSRLAPVTTLATGLLVGGGLGNWLDRVCRHGAVIDFVDIGVGQLYTGFFNLADVAITGGAVILILADLRRRFGERLGPQRTAVEEGVPRFQRPARIAGPQCLAVEDSDVSRVRRARRI